MKNVLWVQTEFGDSLWLNGKPCSKEYVDYIYVVDNKDFHEVEASPFKIYYNKLKHEVVVNGHVVELDSAKRRIPFAFYIDIDNIFKVMEVLKKLVNEKGFTISKKECDTVLSLYFNQKFIPFLTKRRLKGVTAKGLVTLVSLLFFFIVFGFVLN
ncbi:hypothetical protein [Fibrobacter sp. UWB13]|uniref:hypothetical protein n=1 Tax=Fibrobacter sp. UWB13 TaxID=1896204 RepID=UPI000A0DC7F8|nr:hypothetical protein [Fibrobacter sp. UWB13]SMG32375.1 hypothetical protein SAMN05720489_2214 [Fibrobacter sp. UWB13]